MRTFIPTTLIAALVLGGCSQDAGTTVAPDNDTAANAATVAVPAAPLPPKSPEEAFLNMFGATSAYVMAAATLARDKGSTPAVKAAGKGLTTTFESVPARLKASAIGKPGIFIDSSLDPQQRAGIDALGAASGAAFDRAFATQMSTALTALLPKLEAYRTTGKTYELQVLCNKIQPKIRADLARVKAI